MNNNRIHIRILIGTINTRVLVKTTRTWCKASWVGMSGGIPSSLAVHTLPISPRRRSGVCGVSGEFGRACATTVEGSELEACGILTIKGVSSCEFSESCKDGYAGGDVDPISVLVVVGCKPIIELDVLLFRRKARYPPWEKNC